MARPLPLIAAPVSSRSQAVVVHVLESASVDFLAQAQVVMTLGHGLAPDRYRLLAWFMQEHGPLIDILRAANVEARHVPFRGFGDPSGAVRIARGLRRDNPSIVHLHVGGRSLPWLIHTASKAKVIAHLHGSRGEDGERLPLHRVADAADAVVANSRAVASTVSVPVTVAYPGVAGPPATTLRRPHERPTIGVVGRLAPIKGHRYLISAMKYLRDSGIKVHAEIAGCGECLADLRRLADRSGVEDSVTFLGWCKDVRARHAGWDLLVAPSLYEGFGLAVLEAMASGLPVVASAVGGLQEVVKDGETGFLVSPGDPQALAKSVRRLLEDESLRAAMGAAARVRAINCFSEARMVEQIAWLYDQLNADTIGQ